jgi:hypothetical protein
MQFLAAFRAAFTESGSADPARNIAIHELRKELKQWFDIAQCSREQYGSSFLIQSG